MAKIIVDSKTGLPKFIVEEKDLLDILHIQDMMSGNFICHKCGMEGKNYGWEKLQGYLESEKIKLEKKAYDSLEMKQDDANTRLKFSEVKGFKHFLDLPDKIVAQAERLREKLKSQQQQQQKENDDDDGTNDKPNEYGD